MENVINKILEIDEKARMMIAEAEEKKQSILKEAHNNEALVKEDFVKKSKDKLDKVDEVHKLESNEKITEIESDKQDKLKALDEVYNNNHDNWEKEIINNIIDM